MASGKRSGRSKRQRAILEKHKAANHVRLDQTAGADSDAWDVALARAEAGQATPDRVEQAAVAGRVTLDGDGAGGDNGQPAAPTDTNGETGRVDLEAERTAAATAERERIADVTRICLARGVDRSRLDGFITGGQTGDEVIRELWNVRANEHDRQDEQSGGRLGRVEQMDQQTDIGRVSRGVSDALIQLTGSDSVARVQAHEREALGDTSHRIDGGEFRNMRASELIRCHFSRAGHHVPPQATEHDVAEMMFRQAMHSDGFSAGGQLQADDWDRVRLARSFRPWTIAGEGGRVQLESGGGGGLPGAQGRDQFPNVLRDAMHRVLHAWFAGDSGEDLIWRDIARIVSASDFRPHFHTFIGGLPDFKGPKPESGDYETVQLGDGEQSSIAIMRKGYYVRISYETIVNDDLGRVMETTMHMGAAANRTVENRLWDDVLNANGGLGRAPAGGANHLFTADGLGNLLTGAVTDDSIFEAWARLKKQKAVEDHDFAGIMGDTIICETERRGLFETILYDDRQISDAQGRGRGGPRNRGVGGKIRTLLDSPRFSGGANPLDRWYLLSSTRRAIAAAFLRGRDEPYLQQMEKWDMSGTCYFGALDFEVKALSARGMMMSTGRA